MKGKVDLGDILTQYIKISPRVPMILPAKDLANQLIGLLEVLPWHSSPFSMIICLSPQLLQYLIMNYMYNTVTDTPATA